MRIDLLALASAPEPIRDDSGNTYAVRPLSAIGWQFLHEWEGESIPVAERLPRLLEMVARHVPDAARETLESWTPAQLLAVLMHAAGVLSAVQSAAVADEGNGAGRPATPQAGARSRRTKR